MRRHAAGDVVAAGPVTMGFVLSNTKPAHGETITATYVPAGNTGTPATPDLSTTVEGDSTFGTGPGAQKIHVSLALTLPGTPAVPPLVETYTAPVTPGLTWQVTSNPHVYSALVP